MAGPFPLHRLVLTEQKPLQSKWRDSLKQIECTGPEFATFAQNFESSVAIFERERTLLNKFVQTRDKQMRTFTFWHLTKQLLARLKVLNFGSLASLVQQLHLQLIQGKKSKPANLPGFVQSFILHQLRSTHWICMSSCEFILKAYEQIVAMVELAHFLPISLALMSIFSRLTLLLSRSAYTCSEAYNRIVQFSRIEDLSTLPSIGQWDILVGKLQSSLEGPDQVEWEDSAKKMVLDDKNQREIDKLNLQLQRVSGGDENDDFGEEIDDDEALVYKPVISTPSTPAPTKKKIDISTHTPSTPTSSKQIEVKKSEHVARISTEKDDKMKEKRKEKHKEKLKDSKRDHDGEKREEKKFSESDDFELMWQSAKLPSSPEKKKKDKHKQKDRESSKSVNGVPEDRKKRKQEFSSASSEIDDLFGLLAPNVKKSKHQ